MCWTAASGLTGAPSVCGDEWAGRSRPAAAALRTSGDEAEEQLERERQAVEDDGELLRCRLECVGVGQRQVRRVHFEDGAWAAVAEVQRVVGDGFVARNDLLYGGQWTHGRTLCVRRRVDWS